MWKDYFPILYCKNQVRSPNIYICTTFLTAGTDWENTVFFCSWCQFTHLCYHHKVTSANIYSAFSLSSKRTFPLPRTVSKLYANGHNIPNRRNGYPWHSNKQTAILGSVCRDRVHWALRENICQLQNNNSDSKWSVLQDLNKLAVHTERNVGLAKENIAITYIAYSVTTQQNP
jgi:hypothetical protein